MKYDQEIATVKGQLGKFSKSLLISELDTVYFVACGGSLATLYPGKYILEHETAKVACGFYNAGEFCAAPPLRIGKHTLVVLNSQSGSTAETLAAANLAASFGCITVAFTTVPNSPLEKAVNFPIYYYDNPNAPYPALLTIFPTVYQMVFALLDAMGEYGNMGKARLTEVTKAMAELEDRCVSACADMHIDATCFASEFKNKQMIYTVGAGIDVSISYVVTNCLFMESIWINSSVLQAGEFFHGALEAIDEKSCVFAFLGKGGTRALEERAVKFICKKTDNVIILDADKLAPSNEPEWLSSYVTPLILNRLAAYYVDRLADELHHPVSSRRYMGVEKY